MAVKRYGWGPGSCDEPGEFEEQPDGEYVKHADYAALELVAKELVDSLTECRKIVAGFGGGGCKSMAERAKTALAAYTALTKGADHAADTGADKQS